jgi:hypothetical protein
VLIESEDEAMLKIVEYGLLAVSLLTVLGLILTAPRQVKVVPQEAEKPQLPPIASR